MSDPVRPPTVKFCPFCATAYPVKAPTGQDAYECQGCGWRFVTVTFIAFDAEMVARQEEEHG